MTTLALVELMLLPFVAADSSYTVPVVYSSTAPVIDGVPADSCWASAEPLTSFIQYEPHRGRPEEQPTQARILLDETHVYVAFDLRETGAPVAQLTRRDSDLLDDDAVIFVLDSFDDRQSAYYFIANALGTQADGRIANDGRTVDRTWDATWQAAASVDEGGWSVEMAIPLSSIRYRAGDNRAWGINFGRSRRRSLELSFWAGPLDSKFRVSQAGRLTGLQLEPPHRRHQLILYGLSRFEEGAKDSWDAGGDVSYAVTPEMSAFATVNPDFATIEADQEEINLSRFELSLPEKRPFFLEGAELFRQRIRTFYSRRIPDIDAGAKMLGRAGPWTLAFLGASARPEESESRAVYGVGRLQRDVLGSSSVALSVSNRSLAGRQVGSAGLDATLFFTRSLGMTGQLVQSWGEFGSGSWGYFIRPALDTPIWHFHVRYTSLGNHFGEHVNALGFVRDDDRRELDSALDRKFWVRRSVFERIEYGSNYNIYWSQGGTLRSWQVDQDIEVEFRNRISLEASHSEEFKRFEKDFRNRRTSISLGYNTRSFQSAEIGYRFGRNFDANFQLWTAEAAYKVTPQLSVEYELQRLVLDPDPEDESTWIHVVRVNQFFTRDLFLRAFFQTNSVIDRRNIQAALVYRYRPPFGTIQLAYQRGTAGFGERSDQGDTLFLKVTGVL